MANSNLLAFSFPRWVLSIVVHFATLPNGNFLYFGHSDNSDNSFFVGVVGCRTGVYLDHAVKIGPGCEIKSSIICAQSAVAHFNYIGNSIVGKHVNFEAGSICANHFNEKHDKRIFITHNNQIIDTKTEKFGSLVGDNSKIGANAVLSPGTILKKDSMVKRLELIEQTN